MDGKEIGFSILGLLATFLLPWPGEFEQDGAERRWRAQVGVDARAGVESPSRMPSAPEHAADECPGAPALLARSVAPQPPGGQLAR